MALNNYNEGEELTSGNLFSYEIVCDICNCKCDTVDEFFCHRASHLTDDRRSSHQCLFDELEDFYMDFAGHEGDQIQSNVEIVEETPAPTVQQECDILGDIASSSKPLQLTNADVIKAGKKLKKTRSKTSKKKGAIPQKKVSADYKLCEDCGQSFRTRRSMETHKMVLLKPLVCKECNAEFLYSCRLFAHRSGCDKGIRIISNVRVENMFFFPN